MTRSGTTERLGDPAAARAASSARLAARGVAHDYVSGRAWPYE